MLMMQENYPTLTKCVRAIKMRKDRIDRLCSVLQRLEAHLILDLTCLPLVQTGKPLATIHDSIIFRESDKEIVENQIYNAFESLGVGIRPELHINPLAAESEALSLVAA